MESAAILENKISRVEAFCSSLNRQQANGEARVSGFAFFDLKGN